VVTTNERPYESRVNLSGCGIEDGMHINQTQKEKIERYVINETEVEESCTKCLNREDDIRSSRGQYRCGDIRLLLSLKN
jgi:hypothetical protein